MNATLLKSVAWLAVGGIGGAVGAALLFDGQDENSAIAGATALVESITGRGPGRAGTSGDAIGIAERLDAYRDAQQETDPEALTRALEGAAGRSWSPARDVEIDALLGRIVELAPDYGAALAVSLGLDQSFVAAAYVAWAETDPDAALAGLGGIANLALRRDVALALTDVFGDDARGIARIGAALSPSDRDFLEVAWVAGSATNDPFAAFREAMNLGEPALTRRALDQVPYSALSQAELLSPELARAFRARVFGEWARIDAQGYAAYLESQGTLPQEAVSGLSYLLASNPELVERIAGKVSGPLAQSVQSAALQARANSDPAGAKAAAEALPPGQQRDQAVQAVAVALARSDPEAAIEWVRGLSPPSTNAMNSLMLLLAQTDVVAALDLLEDPQFAANSQLVLVLATSAGLADPEQAPTMADRLLTRGDAQSQAALRNLVGNWMQRDPEAALEWMLEHGTAIDQAVLAGAAQTLGARNPAVAVAFVDRLPPEQRGVWVTQVASGYGRYDPQAAMSWVSQFQGQDFHEVATRQVISSAAATDPFTASQMLRQASPAVQLGAAQQVATALAQQDPLGAARWAQTLSDPRARATAEQSIVNTWYASQPAAARRFVLSMPAGTGRDPLLSTLAQRAASAGTFDLELVNGLSNDADRQRVAAIAVTAIARQDMAGARTLLRSEITDPALRAQVEAQINQMD
jgi:hypothetical protein